MKLLTRIRSRSQPAATDDVPTGPPHQQLPIARYDQLTTKQIASELSGLSQIELGEIEAYERAHSDRKPVLDKLRYMRSPEPLPGYDALAQRDVVRLLEDADTARVRAIRDYERKFRRRHNVMSAAAKALPRAAVNPDEQDRRGEKALRTQTGIADRTNRLA
jgi:hypothetical protein